MGVLAAERHAKGLPGYEKAWKVRFLEMPALAMGGGRDSWALTRLMSGEAPEFMWAQSTPEYADRCDKWYIDLSPYLNRPNPYVPGNQRWIDIFYPDALSNWRATVNRHLYCIPIDQVEIAVFYNKRILARCGITESDLPPKNWAEFIALQRRIQQAGGDPLPHARRQQHADRLDDRHLQRHALGGAVSTSSTR